MKDENIKKMLISYMSREMELLVPEEMEGYSHVYSTRYYKKWKQILRTGKMFGTHIRLGYAVRKAAMIALFLLGLLTVTEVSAKVFGFNPWKYIYQYKKESRMEGKIYQTPVESDSVQRKITKELPDGIPKNYTKTDFDKSKLHLFVQWNVNDTTGIQYTRYVINQGAAMLHDSEYEKKVKLDIAGYGACYYQKGNEAWILWTDLSYEHSIYITNSEKAQELLTELAQSLYE